MNIHKKPITEEDKNELLKIIQKQNRTAIRHTFKMPCACCQKPTPIYFLYKCFYCGVWFCHKCAEEHFISETEMRTEKRCSGHGVFPDGSKCQGCEECKETIK